MSPAMRSPERELLTKLLDSHERSASYGRRAPWPRDVILKLDERNFPEAFSPDGREVRTALLRAARALESEGRVRLTHHARGPLTGEPKEVRLGPSEIERAYAAATELGYEPLATGLEEIRRHALPLAAESSCEWMRSFLERLADGTRRAELSPLGMSRERFKSCWRDLLPALTAAAALANGIEPGWERVVSERLLGDSKLLGSVRPLIVAVLVRGDPRWDGIPPEEAGDLLEAYGVRRKPGLIRCAGAGTLRIESRAYRLEDFVPVAHLPESWGDSWIEAMIEAGIRQVTTIENEYPFLSYVEESGGPAGLGARSEVAVYTAGFPSPSLVRTLAQFARREPRIAFRHWGDADVGGIRIWFLLRARIGREIDLFRTTSEWVRSETARGGRPLSGTERSALSRLHTELASLDGNDVIGVLQLIDALIEVGGKLEQERF